MFMLSEGIGFIPQTIGFDCHRASEVGLQTMD